MRKKVADQYIYFGKNRPYSVGFEFRIPKVLRAQNAKSTCFSIGKTIRGEIEINEHIVNALLNDYLIGDIKKMSERTFMIVGNCVEHASFFYRGVELRL